MMCEPDRSGEFVWLSHNIGGPPPGISPLESFAFHGWATGGASTFSEISITTASGSLVFPRSRPIVIRSCLDDKTGLDDGLSLRGWVTDGEVIAVNVYCWDTVIRLFSNASSALLSGKSLPDDIANGLLAQHGVTPVRTIKANRPKLENLTGARGEYVVVHDDLGGTRRKVLVDRDRLSHQIPYYCFGLCLSAPEDISDFLTMTSDNSDMYRIENIAY